MAPAPRPGPIFRAAIAEFDTRRRRRGGELRHHSGELRKQRRRLSAGRRKRQKLRLDSGAGHRDRDWWGGRNGRELRNGRTGKRRDRHISAQRRHRYQRLVGGKGRVDRNRRRGFRGRSLQWCRHHKQFRYDRGGLRWDFTQFRRNHHQFRQRARRRNRNRSRRLGYANKPRHDFRQRHRILWGRFQCEHRRRLSQQRRNRRYRRHQVRGLRQRRVDDRGQYRPDREWRRAQGGRQGHRTAGPARPGGTSPGRLLASTCRGAEPSSISA